VAVEFDRLRLGLNVLVVVNKKNVVGVFVVMGAGFVDALSQWWRTTAEHSKHVHLNSKHSHIISLLKLTVLGGKR